MSSSGKFIIGTSDFNEIIEKNANFIDKTLFIRDFIDSSAESHVIHRPRRFGKSTNLFMLKFFLSFDAVPGVFERFAIAKDKEFMEKHFAKYPVVYLDLKDCKGSWKEIYESVWIRICRMVYFHRNELNGIESASKLLELDYTAPPDNEAFASSCLFQLTKALNEKYRKRVIVLIDECDSPLNSAFQSGCYEKASSFFEMFYSCALKGNSYLEKACLVGIVELSGQSRASVPNNCIFSTVYDEMFSQYFGFTKKEIEDYAGDKLQQVLEYYNGYTIGSQKLISPWSFVNWLATQKEFKSYWITSSSQSISNFVAAENIEKALLLIINLLNSKYEIKLGTTVFPSFEQSFCHFLIQTGYLTFERIPERENSINAVVPNKEICRYMESEMKDLLNNVFSPRLQKDLREAVLDLRMEDLESVKYLEYVIKNLFSNINGDVSSYHLLFYGLLRAILHDNIDCFVNFETENELVRVEFRSQKRDIYFAMKRCFDLEVNAQKTLNQIKTTRLSECIGVLFLLDESGIIGMKVFTAKN